MTKEDFLLALEDILQTDDPIEIDLQLEELEEWDSLAMMAVIAYYKKNFGINIVLKELKEVKTPADLIALAGDKIND